MKTDSLFAKKVNAKYFVGWIGCSAGVPNWFDVDLILTWVKIEIIDFQKVVEGSRVATCNRTTVFLQYYFDWRGFKGVNLQSLPG